MRASAAAIRHAISALPSRIKACTVDILRALQGIFNHDAVDERLVRQSLCRDLGSSALN
jgi:hypothetical protein